MCFFEVDHKLDHKLNRDTVDTFFNDQLENPFYFSMTWSTISQKAIDKGGVTKGYGNFTSEHSILSAWLPCFAWTCEFSNKY